MAFNLFRLYLLDVAEDLADELVLNNTETLNDLIIPKFKYNNLLKKINRLTPKHMTVTNFNLFRIDLRMPI